MHMKINELLKKQLIPETSIKRLILYKRCLEKMDEEGIRSVRSGEISNKCGVNSSVIRKDFSYFGDFGVRGKGYEVGNLINGINNLISSKEEISVVLVGAGKLGQAILHHSDDKCEVKFKVAFDNDRSKVNKTFNGIKILPVDEMEIFIKKNKIKIAVVAVPCTEARSIITRLVDSGIKSILSLALVPVKVPDDVEISFMDILPEVEFLHFKLKQRSIL
ncbi:MAG: redox-sensing transcriptional repressor Rex [Acidobacteriota bacterium]